MKIQDIVFFVILFWLWIIPVKKKFVYAGIFSLLIAIPLFSIMIFFSAERLTWYAAAFFLIHTLKQINHLNQAETI